jgi:hypothetical protein
MQVPTILLETNLTISNRVMYIVDKILQYVLNNGEMGTFVAQKFQGLGRREDGSDVLEHAEVQGGGLLNYMVLPAHWAWRQRRPGRWMQGEGRAGDGQRAAGRAAGEVNAGAGQAARCSGGCVGQAAAGRRARSASTLGMVRRRRCSGGCVGQAAVGAVGVGPVDSGTVSGTAASFGEITGGCFVSDKGVVRSACFSANDREPLER